jgi:hypothetical protein
VEAATGTRISEARVSLQAAMTREVASRWAKRIKMEAVDTASMPNKMATMGGKGGCLGESIYRG